MSEEPKGYTQSHIDPEKGILDPLPLRLPYDQKDEKQALPGSVTPPSVYPSSKEKEVVITTTKEVVVTQKSSKPAPRQKKKVSKWVLFQLWFNTYRKFFTFTFGFNMIGLALAASGHFPYAIKFSGAMVVANFNFAILMRNEVFGRLLYLFINTCFAKWPPLWFRLGCTSVLQHLGGIHSGCALSGVIWLLFKVVNNFRNLDVNHDAILIMGVVTNLAVMISALSAFPGVFERHHRFVGWIGLISTWVFVILGDTYDPLHELGILTELISFATKISVTALPYLGALLGNHLQRSPSSASNVECSKVFWERISRSSIMEYHAFGIISEGKHAEYHYMIAGVQGDFTRSLVQNPPKTLWTRELKFAGVSNTSTLYKRGIRVCTGTGIGAALSTCLQSPYWYLIWIGSEQEKTFGPTISGLIHKHIGPERLLLWDSKARGGRPDTMKILKEAYTYWDAEVVFITSNYIGNSEIMQGCKEAGIQLSGRCGIFNG
ncbi:hypothetical protein BDQ17DRAFT_1421532 [Cyathus striatus]|nr:hypothetical protein BDQ17DRAFT_1421532 [Cyathus striatus]